MSDGLEVVLAAGFVFAIALAGHWAFRGSLEQEDERNRRRSPSETAGTIAVMVTCAALLGGAILAEILT